MRTGEHRDVVGVHGREREPQHHDVPRGERPAVFGPGRTALACWTVRHPENAALLRALQKATGAATCKAA